MQNSTHYPTGFRYWPTVNDHWGPRLQTLQGPKCNVTAVASSFDGKYLAFAELNSISLWNNTTSILHCALEGHGEVNQAIAFSRNGHLASTSLHGKVRVWEPVVGTTCRILEVKGRPGRDEVDFVANSAVSWMGRMARIWRPVDDIEISPEHEARGLAFLSNGNLALACSSSSKLPSRGQLILLDQETYAQRCIPCTDFTIASFSSNDRVALVSKSGKLRVYNLST